MVLLFGELLLYSVCMPKTTKKKSVKAVKTVRKASCNALSDNKLIISALVLLLAVAVFMLVEAWTGVK